VFSQSLTPDLWTAKTADPHDSRESVLAKIDAVLADEDLYETGEPRPSPQTVDLVRSLINGAVDPKRRIPKAEVSVYFGELDVTWKHRNRLLRLVAFRDSARRPVLYTQTDGSEALTRGHSIEVTGNDDLSNALDWLLA